MPDSHPAPQRPSLFHPHGWPLSTAPSRQCPFSSKSPDTALPPFSVSCDPSPAHGPASGTLASKLANRISRRIVFCVHVLSLCGLKAEVWDWAFGLLTPLPVPLPH